MKFNKISYIRIAICIFLLCITFIPQIESFLNNQSFRIQLTETVLFISIILVFYIMLRIKNKHTEGADVNSLIFWIDKILNFMSMLVTSLWMGKVLTFVTFIRCLILICTITEALFTCSNNRSLVK